jgi:elongation factor 1-gamma
MNDHPSYEFHKFNKLSKANEADRKLFEEYWMNQTEDESVVKGLRLRDSVYFR